MDERLAYGMALCQEGRFEQAIGMFKAELRRDPERMELHQWLVSTMVAWAKARGLTRLVAAPRPTPPHRISVVVCSINPARLAGLWNNLRALIPEDRLELIHVPDARSMCEGFNRGARRATADTLVFCHDDIRILTPDFAWKIGERLRTHEVVGVAGSTRLTDARWGTAGFPYTSGQVVHRLAERPGVTYSAFGYDSPVGENMQSLDGLLIAMNRDVWAKHLFDEGYPGFHLYDVDFVFRCHLAGARIAVCNDILVEHHSLGAFDAAWKQAAEMFMARFGARLACHAPGVLVSCNFRLGSIEQAWGLFHALHAFGYGVDIPAPGGDAKAAAP